MALVYTPESALGTSCPDFSLPGVDGRLWSRQDLMQNSKGFLVMFICNHCPYVKAIEDRLVQLGRDLSNLGLGCLAICSNDPEDYPEDNFENMKARAQEKNYSFPYAQDLSQDVARNFGAVCTPDFFLYDGQARLVYRGRLDDSWKDPSRVKQRELWQAAVTLAQGQKVESEQIPSMGCSIKWRAS